MYDISNLNNVSDLDDLLTSVNQILSGKGVDEETRKLCLATRKAILQKITAINKERKRNGH